MGAPPHGGFAMGIERFVAQLAGEPDIRQVVAFPKVSSGADPLTGAPTPMPNEVLRRARHHGDRARKLKLALSLSEGRGILRAPALPDLSTLP